MDSFPTTYTQPKSKSLGELEKSYGVPQAALLKVKLSADLE